MNEPRRLSEDSSLGGLDRAVLRSASFDRPSPSARLAAQAALGIGAGAAVSLAAGTASGASAVAATTAATAKSAALASFIKIGLAVVAVSGAMVAAAPFARDALRETAPPKSAPAAVRSPQPHEPAGTGSSVTNTAPSGAIDDAVSIDSLPLAQSEPKRALPALPKPPRAAASTRLGEEVALIETARAKVAIGDSAAALAALDEYARVFGAGALAPEAAALRKLAKSIASDQNAPSTP